MIVQKAKRGVTSGAKTLIIAALMYSSLGGLGPPLSAQAACSSDLICYDAKITHDQAIWAISDVLRSHGYDVERTPKLIIQNHGGIWMRVPSDVILYVRTAWRGSPEWRYVAEVQPDGSPIVLRVVKRVPTRNLFGDLVDEEPFDWQPPDVVSIRTDIRERLQGD